MKRCSVYSFLAFAILFCKLFAMGPLQAADSNPPKKYNLSIAAVLTDDSKNLKEWIEYHRLVGVDHFYLYSTNRDQPYLRVLAPYMNSRLVTLINWQTLSNHIKDKKSADWALAVQTPAYQHAILCRAVKESKWITFLEVNEFLLPAEEGNLLKILEKYKDSPGITMTSDTFDASPKKTFKQKFLIETLGLIKDEDKNLMDKAEKTILKPELCESFTWPPYKCVFKAKQQPIVLSREELRVNHYVDVPSKMRERLCLDSKKLAEGGLSEFLDLGYEIEDQERPIQRFLPELSEKMGK